MGDRACATKASDKRMVREPPNDRRIYQVDGSMIVDKQSNKLADIPHLIGPDLRSYGSHSLSPLRPFSHRLALENTPSKTIEVQKI